jgi:signal transduction histidine kinase
VAEDDRERIFEPGARGAAGTTYAQGTGLGLALARRLARAADGDVRSEASASGACFVIDLPAG